MEILDADRLRDAVTMDGRYHAAKLQAWAFHEPQNIITEQTQFRSMVLAGPSEAPLPPEDWLARVAAIHRKMQRAGLVPSTSGAMH